MFGLLRCAQDDAIARARLHQRARQRRHPTDVAAVQIDFVDADDADDVFVAGGVLVGDGRAEEHARGRRSRPRRGRIDDFGRVDAFRQKADPRVDLAQPPFAVEVVGVLAAVAVAGGPGHDLRHRRPFPVHQEPVFVFQALQPCGRDVVLQLRPRRLAHGLSQGSFRSHSEAILSVEGVQHARASRDVIGVVRGVDSGRRRQQTRPSTQSVQYRSPEGVEYRSLPDTDAVKSARAALEADPRNIARIIDLGVAQSGARQFREAIATFTRGLEIEPNNALLLRWRGHRYLSVREFDRAFADLTRGGAIDSTIYGIWYHLGVVQFLRGDFAEAAASFAKAQPIAPDAGELAGSTDWLWMSLSRAGRGAEAKAMLDRRPDSKPVTNAYTRRLQLYRGEIGPEAVVTPADTDEVQVATLAYGLGNWYLVRGDKAQARRWFERSIQSGGWPGFGFIVSEVELRRLGVSSSLHPRP